MPLIIYFKLEPRLYVHVFQCHCGLADAEAIILINRFEIGRLVASLLYLVLYVVNVVDEPDQRLVITLH